MAFSKKRTSSNSTGSRAKKPVRFVKTRSESARSGATPTSRTTARPRTTAANSRNTTGSTSRGTSAANTRAAQAGPAGDSPRKKAASRKASNLKSTAQKVANKPASSREKTSRPSRSSRTASRKPAQAKTLQIAPGTLPTWGDLADSQVIQQNARPEVDHWFGAVSTARFAVIILALATVFTLYVGHVFATQDLLTEVQQLRNEQLALEMTYDKLEGELHHVTGPEEIFAAANALGLTDRVHRGTPIVLSTPR
jgi:hypothetical protein